MNEELRPVLAVSKHRDIIFGYVPKDFQLGTDEKISMKNARQGVYYSSDMRGFSGLAVQGPSNSCKVSFSVDEFTLLGCVRLLDCTEEAAKKWEQGPWNS